MIQAVCRYCGSEFSYLPLTGVKGGPAYFRYCPLHREQYYKYRVCVGQTPLTGYQDIRPGRKFKIPLVGQPLRRNYRPGAMW